MGRKKQGYSAPEGLIRRPNSPYWHVKKRILGVEIKGSSKIRLDALKEAIPWYYDLLAEKAAEIKERAKNKILGHGSFAFKDIIDMYLKEESPRKSKGGRNDLNSSKFVLQHFKGKLIDEIKPQDIGNYIRWRQKSVNDRLGRPVRGSTINRELSFMNQVFKYAIGLGYIEDNPAKNIRRLSESPPRDRYLEDDEFFSILSHMKDSVRDMFLALYYSGQRPGDIYSLKWEQINLTKREISFNHKSYNKKRPSVLWINDKLFQILKKYQLRNPFSKYVFYKKGFTPYSDQDAYRAWRSGAKKAGIEGTMPYHVRHKAISDLIRAGIDPVNVSYIAGHSDPRTTKRYTHLSAKESITPLSVLSERMLFEKNAI